MASKKAFVFGIGRMGTAISWGMRELGFNLACADASEDAWQPWLQGVDAGHANEVDFYHGKRVTQEDGIIALIAEVKPDIVISSLPYHQTEQLAKVCIDHGIPYCDLGGRVDVSQRINDYATQHATRPVMTDLGLAPGWVNILAEEGCRKLSGAAEEVEMMVGGLPDYLESTNNPLRYAVTWSVDGLINEYRDDCLILEDGEVKTVRGMDGLEEIEGEKFGKMEAFYTSGGASHSIESMKSRGIKNCSYKTMRYRGHGEIVKFLIRDCNLDDKTLTKIFQEGCGSARKDEVLIMSQVKGGAKRHREEKVIKSDERFSAMQKATAFPICSVASLIADKFLEGDRTQCRDYWTQYPLSLSYSDVPFDKFNARVEKLMNTEA